MTDPLMPPDLLASIAADLDDGGAPLSDEEMAQLAAEHTHCEFQLPPIGLTKDDEVLMREMASRLPGFAGLFGAPVGPRGGK